MKKTTLGNEKNQKKIKFESGNQNKKAQSDSLF